MHDNVTFRVRIEGQVQGVGFRHWMLEQAAARGLSGWVRNRADGSLEALFNGPSHVVEAMVAACRQGPKTAKVEHLTTEPAMKPPAKGFHQLPTE